MLRCLKNVQESKSIRFVFLVVTQDGAVQEFVKDKKEYLPLLIETISQWEERNEISINSITNMDNVATV